MSTPRITTSIIGQTVDFLRDKLNCKDIKVELIKGENIKRNVPEAAFKSNIPVRHGERVELSLRLDDESEKIIDVFKVITDKMREEKDYLFDERSKEIIFKTYNAVRILDEQAKKHLAVSEANFFSKKD